METDDSSVNSFAQTVRKVYDSLVKQAHNVGLEFHVLDHFSPQPHDRIRIGMVSAEDFAQITRNRIDVNLYDKQGLSGKALDNFLKEVYFTLSSLDNKTRLERNDRPQERRRRK